MRRGYAQSVPDLPSHPEQVGAASQPPAASFPSCAAAVAVAVPDGLSSCARSDSDAFQSIGSPGGRTGVLCACDVVASVSSGVRQDERVQAGHDLRDLFGLLPGAGVAGGGARHALLGRLVRRAHPQPG
jgi:hypothetical protein